MSHVIDHLDHLHDGYVAAINFAISRGDVRGANALASEYADEALELISQHTNRAA